jgi:hypothetical protein
MFTRLSLQSLQALALPLIIVQAEFAFGEGSGPDYFKVTGVASDRDAESCSFSFRPRK